MSKVEKFLNECKKNLGKWTCASHNSESSQPAATFREVKKMGYEFEEISANRWGKQMYCKTCGRVTTHYKLLKAVPTLTKKERLTIDKKTRERILNLFSHKDAFTGASISSCAEIDHKIPWTRLDKDIDATKLSDNEIKEHFQLLTREHNLLKDRLCGSCKLTNVRPPFLGIPFWYEGDSQYKGSCKGCGWYDGKKWREEISKLIKNSNSKK